MRRECEAAGNQAAWAKAIGVSPAYVCDVLQRRRRPGHKILAPMGLERYEAYRRVAPSAAGHEENAGG